MGSLTSNNRTAFVDVVMAKRTIPMRQFVGLRLAYKPRCVVGAAVGRLTSMQYIWQTTVMFRIL